MMPSRKAEGEVEAAPGRITLFKPGDDAQGMQVVVEAEAVLAQRGVEGFFAGVAEGRMADVVGEGEGLSELTVQAQSFGEGAGDLGYFERVGEPAAEMVAGKSRAKREKTWVFPARRRKARAWRMRALSRAEGESDKDGAVRDVCGQTGIAVAIDGDVGGRQCHSFRFGSVKSSVIGLGLVISQRSGGAHGGKALGRPGSERSVHGEEFATDVLRVTDAATKRSAIESFLRRIGQCSGIREYDPADFSNCAGRRRNFAHSDILYIRTGGKNEDDEMCWIGPGGLWSCIHDRLRQAFEQRSFLPGFVEYGIAILANGREGV